MKPLASALTDVGGVSTSTVTGFATSSAVFLMSRKRAEDARPAPVDLAPGHDLSHRGGDPFQTLGVA